MQRLFIMLGLLAAPLAAQDCSLSWSPITAAGSTSAFDNRTRGCVTWTIAYNSTGFSGLTITVEGAPDNNGSPGAWATITAETGANPNTSTDQNSATFATYYPWLRVTVSGLTGSGSIRGVLYGSRVGAQAGADPSGGGCTAPCVVVGPDAPAAAATDDPVQAGLVDGGGLVRRLLGNTSGRLVNQPKTVSLALADGISNTQAVFQGEDSGNTTPYAPSLGHIFNGTTWDRMRGNSVGAYVHGVLPAGSAAATINPVMIGGNAGGVLRTFFTDTSGFMYQAGINFALADDQNNTVNMLAINNSGNGGLRVFPMVFDGTTWDRKPGNSTAGTLVGGRGHGAAGSYYPVNACERSAVINVAAGATQELVSVDGTRQVRVCAFAITADTAATTAQFQSGTGTTCGTGTTNLTGAMRLADEGGLAMGSGLGEIFKTAPSQALCIAAVTGAVTGIVSYVQY